LYYLCSLY